MTTWNEAIMDKKIVESKKEMRKRLAALSFTEKIKILEKLRDRDRAIAAAGRRRTPKDDRNGDSRGRGK